MRLARHNVTEKPAVLRPLSDRDLFRCAAIHHVEHLVSKSMCVPIHMLRSKKRGSPIVCFARHVAMYLAHVGLSLSLNEVGMVFGRDRTTVQYACRSVEDERDDAVLDALLDMLELELIEWRKHWDCA